MQQSGKEQQELLKMIDKLPPHMQEKVVKAMVEDIGSEKIGLMLMKAIETNAPPFRTAVSDLTKRLDDGAHLIEHTKGFMDALREQGRGFMDCWAAMTLLLAIGATENSLIEMLGYALAYITFEGQVPPTPDTPESAAAKAKAARKIADEFIDLGKLADEMRDERK